MNKVFRFEDFQCHDEIFKKFITFAKKKRSEISRYLKDLVTFDMEVGDPIKDEESQRFVAHSMILNLDDVNTLYDFFKDFMEEFTTSKQAIKNLCQK